MNKEFSKTRLTLSLALITTSACVLFCTSLISPVRNLEASVVTPTLQPKKTVSQAIRCFFSPVFFSDAPEYCKSISKDAGAVEAASLVAASPTDSKPALSKVIPPKAAVSLPSASTTMTQTKGYAAGITRAELNSALAGLKSELATIFPKNETTHTQSLSYSAYASGGYSVPPGNTASTDYVSSAVGAAIGTVPVPWTSSASALYYTGGMNVGVGTSTPSSVFEVAGKTAAFNTSLDGSLGEWSTNANALPVALTSPSTVTANGYVYVSGGSGSDTVIRTLVYYAKLNSDGSIGSWTTNANSLPVGKAYHTSAVYNGYIYAIGGLNPGYTAVNTVYYAKINADGSTGAWATGTALPAVREGHTTVIANGYVYVIGGGTAQNGSSNNSVSTVYYAKINADGSLGSWSTNANALPAAIQLHTSFMANGYVYAMGGSDVGGCWSGSGSLSTIYYARLNADGSTGAWATNTNALWTTQCLASSVVSNGYVYNLGGVAAGNIAPTNFKYAKLNGDGSIGTWSENTNVFPGGNGTARFTQMVAVNGYVYVMGGAPASSAIYYASTARVRMSGTLDLLGLTIGSGGMTGSSGDAGGSIYAGSIYSANKLEVGGNAQFWNGLSVNGAMSIFAATSTATSSMVFNIAGTSTPILSILGNGNVGIGTTTPVAKLQVSGGSILLDNVYGVSMKHTDGTLATAMQIYSDNHMYISTNRAGSSVIFRPGVEAEAMRILSSGYIGMGTTTPAAKLWITGTSGTTTPTFVVASSSNAASFAVASAGNVGIGTTTPSAQLTNTGTVRFAALGSGGANLITDALGNVTVSSDERLKDIQGDFEIGLEQILKIDPVTYKWKSETGYDATGTYAGFSAQNVQGAIPEAVTSDSKGFLTLADRPIIAALVNAVKELAHSIESMATHFKTKFLEAGDIQADKLCLGTVCITETELRDVLQSRGTAGAPGIAVPAPTPVPMPTSTPIVVPNTASESETVSESAEVQEQVPAPTPTPTPDSIPAIDLAPASIAEIVSAPEPALPAPVPAGE